MARGSPTSKRRPETSATDQDRAAGRLCLTGAADAIAAALGQVEPGVVAVVIVTPSGGAAEATRARMIADRHDVAFLVADDPALAVELGADGVEIDWSPESYGETRALIGADRSVGARVGPSRHRAMEAAEAGADYVRFAPQSGAPGDIDAMIDMVQWWAEIFEVPCMASGPIGVADLGRLAAAGADFIAIDAADFAPLGPALVEQLRAPEAAS